jgi:hypothetical protein
MMLSNLMKKGGVPKPKSDQAGVNKGLQEESSEHPWLSPAQARRLVMDHLKIDPNYYGDEEEDESEDKGEDQD